MELKRDDWKLFRSSGEYDLVIQMPFSCVLECIQGNMVLSNAERDSKEYYKEEFREILRNNTKLAFEEKDKNQTLEKKLKKCEFNLEVDKDKVENSEPEKENWKELIDCESYGEEEQRSNKAYYNGIRTKMADMILPSAGVIDMLDLLYTDYLGTLASSYNQTWVTDFHRQFKAVLYAIEVWLDYQKQSEYLEENEYLAENDDFWEEYRDLANAFKQQIYHLSQSSRMVLDIPRSHFRMTGQYDLLLHTYYGFTKIILEAIYLMQGQEQKAEMIPLITVNTVPQVQSELYCDYGGANEIRTINLTIPASIIFDPQRGLRYLVHELFHYAVPQSRERRNWYMGSFIISEYFKIQFIHIFNQMLYTTVNGTVDNKLKTMLTEKVDFWGLSYLVQKIFFTNPKTEDTEEERGKYWLNNEILKFVQANSDEWWRDDVAGYKDTFIEYQDRIIFYCQDERSNDFFVSLCEHLMEYAYKKFINRGTSQILKELHNRSKNDLNKMLDRFLYCVIYKQYQKLLFLELRTNFNKDEETSKKIVSVLLQGIKEARCDIAMISLTSMGLDDYMLFCVQAWRDSDYREFNAGKLEAEAAQILRCGLVCEYFSRDEWKQEELGKFKEKFIKKYIWFYSKKKGGKDDEIFSEAMKCWKDFIKRCIIDFGRTCSGIYLCFSFYDPIFANVLSDFDVKRRANELCDLGKDKDRGNRLKEICKDIEEIVFRKYNSMIEAVWLPNAYTWDSEQAKNYPDKRFRHDLAVAQHFQIQKSFKELSAINLIVRKSEKEANRWHLDKPVQIPEEVSVAFETPWNFHVRSLEELLFYLQHCERRILEENEKEPIWFRGQANNSYNLVPSIMREYNRKRQEQYASLRAFQQCEFEEFKFCADGAPEMPVGVRFTLSDYIALMQHYCVPTTFLDWSENAFSALYFALEHYFENTGEKNDVALYLLKPKKCNSLCVKKARSASEKIHGASNEVKEHWKWIKNTVTSPTDWMEGSIPNFSIKQNKKIFDSYLLGNLEFDKKFSEWKKNPEEYEELRECAKDLYRPVAVWTSRLNTRIRTQSGCFVAFNLYTLPDLYGKGTVKDGAAFDYVSLEKFQEEVLDKDTENVFLYKITIDGSCCEQIMKWLRGMGISRSSVYPELELLKKRF